MLKKSLMVALLLVAAQAHAVTWEPMFNQGNVKYFRESDSSGPVRGWDSIYIAHYRTDFSSAKKADGKYFDKETFWLTKDCANQRFMVTKIVRYINGKEVYRKEGLGNQWIKYDESKNQTTHRLWREHCLQ